ITGIAPYNNIRSTKSATTSNSKKDCTDKNFRTQAFFCCRPIAIRILISTSKNKTIIKSNRPTHPLSIFKQAGKSASA
ncbi:hypothetical protein, partial [Thermoactinomyces mirandus]|uniref:hypothetical protein n=1 Tax=Thermoactinomyces mirandus TaxID=2756294 RepID=UPI001C68B015